MGRVDTTALADELTQEYDYMIDLSGHLSDISETAHRERIRAMLEKVIERDIPEDEVVQSIEVIFDPWDRPIVRVWCNSSGFNYENNQVTDQSFMVNGHLYRFKVDVRPF